MASGLRFRLTVQSLSQTTDGQGGFTNTWADVADVWASLEPVKGYERYQAMQTQTPVTHKIILRYRSDVTTKHRLLYGSRVFVIKELLNVGEMNRFLQIKALEQQ